jgi:hypothetical protein
MRKSDLVKTVAREVDQPENHVASVVNATFDVFLEGPMGGGYGKPLFNLAQLS